MSRDKRRGPPPGTASPRVAMENASAAYGNFMPEWVRELAEACDRTSQAAVARRIGYTGSVISAVLRRTYAGNPAIVEQAVRGALMGEHVDCPVDGSIARDACLSNQKAAMKFHPTSHRRVQLFRCCRGACPHSRMALTKEDQQ